jgi:hypothetical protein
VIAVFGLPGSAPAATDPPFAMTQLAMAKQIVQQLSCVIGVIGQRFAEIFCARAFLLCHGSTHRNDGRLVPRCLCDCIIRLLANLPPFTHNSRVNAAGGFMLVVRSRSFQLGLMLATALSISMLPTAGRAYTADQQQACTGDAFRLCSSEIPDVDRVTVCMIRNKAQLTPGCRAFFGPSGPEAAADRPVNIRAATARKHVGAHRPRKRVKPDAS